jgi:hypothetical protein
VFTDPSGYGNFFEDLVGDIKNGIHRFGHAMSVNMRHESLLEALLLDRPDTLLGNPNYRQDAEIGLAVAACIVLDIFAPYMAACDEVILSSVGQAAVWAGPVGSNAVIGGIAGGAIKGTWKGAAQGAIYGAALGAGFNCVYTGIQEGSWQVMADKAAEYGKIATTRMIGLSDIPAGVAIGGTVNMGFGEAKNPWNDFRDGAIVGGLTSLAGYSGFFDKGVGGYLASNFASRSIYGMFSKRGPEVSA